MKHIIYIILFLFITNCTIKEVKKHHGFNYLDKKKDKLYINKSNKNDILKILGPPSTKGSFNNDVWIYIERTKAKGSLLKFGKTEIETNNILILELDTRGLLSKKNFLTKKDMKNITFSDASTGVNYRKNNFIYNFLSSLRQKVNDPLGKRGDGSNPRKR
jgi:outer membrane protein assembly factor BamE (lipoprotein component of BamABCDE complex)